MSTVHDLSVLDMPEASSRFRAAGEALLVRNALRRADLLIAVSAFTADRIRSVSGRDAVVVELAPAAWTRTAGDDEIAAVRAKYDLPDQFIMQVGTVEPRKNVERLIQAYELLPQEMRREWPLVIAGGKGWNSEAIHARMSA